MTAAADYIAAQAEADRVAAWLETTAATLRDWIAAPYDDDRATAATLALTTVHLAEHVHRADSQCRQLADAIRALR